MKLAHARALITGASGGIGAALAAEIVRCGGKALITARDERVLEQLARSLDPSGAAALPIVADITRVEDRRRLCDVAQTWSGGVNMLINNAGVAAFGMFIDEHPQDIEHTMLLNALAPMQLCRTLLPHLKRQPRAHIVNIGSVFGALAYPGQATYSASKFALRGFSEALRRELDATSVRVHYLAPRATRTPFNHGAVEALNGRLGVAVDSPERVAADLRRMLEREQKEKVIGWPEKLFVRINAVLPRLVDRALTKQTPIIARYAADARKLSSPRRPPDSTTAPISRKAS